MRVLFATYSEKTHFQPLVSLAWALRTAGHEVLVASNPELVGVITGAGLTAVPVGADHTLWRTANRFLTKRVAEVNPSMYDKVRAVKQPPFDVADDPAETITWRHLKDGYDNIVPSWYRTVNEPIIDDLVAFARQWRPDLVLWESATYAGAIAAAAVGAVHARMPCFLDMFGVVRGHYRRLKELQPPTDRGDALAEWLGAQAARFSADFGEELVTGHFTVDQYPESLRMEADLHYVPMRYVPYNGTAVVPRWLTEPPTRPRVCLTLGTTSTERYDGYAFDLQDILDGLADLDIELIATLADAQAAQLRRIPDNTRVVSFVPLHALVPTCAAVIHHGAFGTVNTVGLHGVPQLAVPERHDTPFHARRMVDFGAGLSVHFTQATGTRIRAALVRLLEEPSFRTRAGDLRAEMMSMPAPNDVVPVLEQLVGKYRPVNR